MRVISGKYGGRLIKTLSGRDTRPTTDRVKEAMFSTLDALLHGFEDIYTLDPFAGSGALSIEVLSRGAKFSQMMDVSKKNVDLIKSNLKTLQITSDKFSIVLADAFKYDFTRYYDASYKYNLVFLDPPYIYECQDVIKFINQSLKEVLSSDAVIVYEHKNNNMISPDVAFLNDCGYSLIKQKKYGDTQVSYIKANKKEN